MQRMRRLFLAASLGLGLSGGARARGGVALDFDAWADRLAAAWVQADPSDSSQIDYLPPAVQQQMNRLLTSQAAKRRARLQLARRGLADLAAFKPEGLSATQRVSARLIRSALALVIEDEKFQDLSYPFEQMSGEHLAHVETLTVFHPLRQRDDVLGYLQRLAQLAARMDEATARAQALERKGLRMPRAIIEAALGQMARALAPAPREHALFTTLAGRLVTVPGVSEAEREAWLLQAEALVRDSVQPAYRRAQQLLQAQLPRSTEHMGLAWQRGGVEAYALALRRHTTTSLSAQAIHAIGLREVARIEAEMDQLLRKLGHSEGTVFARFEALNNALQLPPEPDPRPALLARYQSIVDEAERRSREVFNLRPQSACEVRREPAITEATASARYTPPAMDGSRPGIFWVALPGPKFRMVEMRSLSYHEAVPGHHFQSLVMGLEQLPRYRRMFVFGWHTAMGEGWALYAEQLAAEMGWYEGDDVGRLGMLQMQLFRARRLVADTGLHAMKWTRQQAIDYGLPASQVDRYTVWPGQATSYMVGMLRILELRQQAREALGARFDLKDFHDLMMTSGSLPLDVLAEVVDAWVTARKAAPHAGSPLSQAALGA